MIYTVAFIPKIELRDNKLEELLNPSFDPDKYDHLGNFDFILKNSNRTPLVLPMVDRYYKHRSLKKCSKWKTTTGAKNAIKRIKPKLEKKELSFNYYDRNQKDKFWSQEYVPVICDITKEWNEYINQMIESETKKHEKKINTLRKKLG